MEITDKLKKLYQLKKAEQVLKDNNLMDLALQTKINKEVAKYGNLGQNK